MSIVRAIPLSALLLVSACRAGDGEGAGPAERIVDTTNANAMDGLSSEEVAEQAQALTPEQAAARGIAVDSSIHVENLSPSDSAPDSAAVRRDSARR